MNVHRLCVLFCAFAISTSSRAADAAPAKSPATVATAMSADPAPAIESSIVKVFATARYPDAYKPWIKQAPTEVSGTGIVINGNRILTNAHVVNYASQIQVQPHQSGDKLFAKLEAIAPGIDLAVLKLDDDDFFKTHPAIARSNALPAVEDPVFVYGYPIGGNSLSITKGIISRIEFVGYNNFVSGLRIQIDAAINPGNSGGPALVGGKMIGVAFSTLNNAQNIGYIIPNEEVELFLADIADGKYEGKPALFEEWQKFQNPQLRKYLHVADTVQGVVVRQPWQSTVEYPLHKWDIITKIGEIALDDEGMIKIGPLLRVRFDYMVQKIAHDGVVPLTIVRDGKQQVLSVPVTNRRPMLIPDLEGGYPSYFVFGPIVFSAATTQFMGGIDRNGIDTLTFSASPLITRRGDTPAFPGEQIVIISSPFFPSRLAKGYMVPVAWAAKTINGVAVKNLAHAVELIRDATDENVVIEFYGRYLESFVLPRKQALEQTEDILTDNGVRYQASPELLRIWNTKPAKAADK